MTAYIAVCDGCGNFVGVVEADGNDKKGTAKVVSQWITEGFTIEHVSDEEVRSGERGFGCTCPKEQMEMFS